MIDVRSRNPGSSLSVCDDSDETKAMWSSTGPTNEGKWIEVELTVDTGACDTVMPKSMAANISIQQSLQSLRSMEYEVAYGNTILHLGERRCVMWTGNATVVRKFSLQVADVHKVLLSPSRCADMGFEHR